MFAMRHEYTRKTRLRDFVASIGRNTHMIRDSNIQLTAGFAQIQRVTALALRFLNDARPQLHGNSIFKLKKKKKIDKRKVGRKMMRRLICE